MKEVKAFQRRSGRQFARGIERLLVAGWVVSEWGKDGAEWWAILMR